MSNGTKSTTTIMEAWQSSPQGSLPSASPHWKTRFQEHSHHVAPQAQLKGKDAETGARKTAVAKEYPTRLSATLMLGQLLLHDLAHHKLDKTFDHQHLHQFMPPLDPI